MPLQAHCSRGRMDGWEMGCNTRDHASVLVAQELFWFVCETVCLVTLTVASCLGGMAWEDLFSESK